MKFRKESFDCKYGDKKVKWWLDGGTEHLPTIYLMKCAYDWRVYDENDELVKESLWARLRTKKDAVEWVKGFDNAIDEAKQKELEAEQARQEAVKLELQDEKNFNDMYVTPVKCDFNNKVDDMINVKIFSMSKLNSLGEGYAYNKKHNKEPQTRQAKIQEIKKVSCDVYDEFIFDFYNCSLSNSFTGGGSSIDDEMFEGYDNYFDLTPELKKHYDDNCYELVTIVIAENRKPVVVNPEGFNYIRYAGVVA